MKSFLLPRSFSLLLLTFCCIMQVYGQGYLKADGKKIVNGQGEEVILRGIGLGGWMLQEAYMLRLGGIAGTQHAIRAKIEELVGPEKTEDFYQAWLNNHTRKMDMDSMAAWGFNSVRLPMHYHLFTLSAEEEPVKGRHTWLEKGFAMTDSLLQWCKANHIYLILDLHAAPGGQGNDVAISDRDTTQPSLWESEANQKKTIALWRKLAERYANEPWIGGYDIINEPNWGFENEDDKNGCDEKKNEPLKKLMVDITRAIREVDTKHIIIIEGNCWGNNYSGVLPPWDDNMVISFHKYWNYNDEASLQKVLGIREQYNAPLWLGESGENSNLWFTDAIRLVESQGIGWSWWPLKKLGFNNPLEIKVNPGYQKILDYWHGEGPQPKTDEAYDALMQLAESTKLENCIYHPDVIDAMFRQVHSPEAKPFKPHPIPSANMIYAVDYDLGSNGVVYFDHDTANYYISTGGERTYWNQGHVYRNDGVDIGVSQDTEGNGYYVGWIESGEWLQYTTRVEKAGAYTLKVRIASDQDNGKMTLTADGQPLAKNIAVPDTGGDQQWQTIVVKNVQLTPGTHTLRMYADQGGFNLNYIQFTGPVQ